MWPQCLHINRGHVSAAADTGRVWTSGLGRAEMMSEMSLGGDSHFDPLLLGSGL